MPQLLFRQLQARTLDRVFVAELLLHSVRTEPFFDECERTSLSVRLLPSDLCVARSRSSQFARQFRTGQFARLGIEQVPRSDESTRSTNSLKQDKMQNGTAIVVPFFFDVEVRSILPKEK